MSDEKTEDPTPQRLREARSQGQVARSAELTSALSLLATVAVVAAGAGSVAGRLIGHLTLTLGNLGADPGVAASSACHELFWLLLATTPPVLLAGAVAGAAGHLLVGGWNFTSQALRFDFKRINPVSALLRWFSPRMLIHAFCLLLKAAVLIWLSLDFFCQHLWKVAAAPAAAAGPGVWLPMATGFAWRVVTAQLAIGVLDFVYQRWDYRRGLRMSRQELKQEYRQQEGDPQRKARMRAVQRQLVKARSLEGVKRARVVICNPTHVAVAIAYDFSMPAPRVVAKGADLTAQRLKELARQLGVPVVEEPALARALYPLDLEESIPAQLYRTVAEVLISVARAEDYL